MNSLYRHQSCFVSFRDSEFLKFKTFLGGPLFFSEVQIEVSGKMIERGVLETVYNLSRYQALIECGGRLLEICLQNVHLRYDHVHQASHVTLT